VVNNIYSLLSLLEEFGTLPSLMGVPHNWDEAKHATWYRKKLRADLSAQSPVLR